MNINKYFLNLPETKQNEILDICSENTTTDIKVLYIYYALYHEEIDFIYTDKRIESICYLLWKYADRVHYYKSTGNSFGQYLRSLDRKLGLTHFGRLL